MMDTRGGGCLQPPHLLAYTINHEPYLDKWLAVIWEASS